MVPADETLNPADDEVRVDSADQVTGDEFGGVTGDGEGVVEEAGEDAAQVTNFDPADFDESQLDGDEVAAAEAEAKDVDDTLKQGADIPITTLEDVIASSEQAGKFEDITKEELAVEDKAATEPADEVTAYGVDAVKLYEALAVLWGVASGATGRDVARQFLNEKYPDFVSTAKERETAARLS